MAKKILLVDDQSFIRHIYSADLRNQGFEVLCAENGKQALDLLELHTVDLVILDVMMPVMDGFETCSRLRENPKTKHVPVVFLTANTDKSYWLRSVQVGGNEFFVKCPDTSELMVKVKRMINKE